jgi:lysophospholipase L1-like esterase
MGVELRSLNLKKEPSVPQLATSPTSAKQQQQEGQKKGHCNYSSLRSRATGCYTFLFLLSSVIVTKVYLLTRHPPNNNAPVTKWGDLNLEDIGQWCLQPNITTCKCANPIEPMHRHGHKTWTEAHLENVELARAAIINKSTKGSMFQKLDVVFLGDSITEGWRGTSFGRTVEDKQENAKVFDEYFNTETGGQLDGLVLGIAGDKSPNLLWRLQNGEMPEMLTAKVFWVLIGTNDFLRGGEDIDQCSEEVVFMGIRRVVEEIMIRKPDSMIVVNGLLPRSDIGGRLYKEGDKTIMDAIDIVNHHLKEYCKQNNNLDYFEASNVFIHRNTSLGQEEKYGQYIPVTLMEDSLHPTPLGYKMWAEKIREKIKTFIDGTLTVQ